MLLGHSRLTKRVFDFDYDTCQNNWCADVKDVFHKLNLSEHFENKTVVDMKVAS